MSEDEIREALQAARLQLRGADAFWHYASAGAFAAFAIGAPLFMVGHALVKGHPVFDPALGWITGLLGLPALLLLSIQYRRLRFVVVSTALSRAEILAIIQEIGARLEWQSAFVSAQALTFTTSPGFLSGSRGERITVLLDHNRVLVNSIVDPRLGLGDVVSGGRNSKNEGFVVIRLRNAQPK
ncbi:hypothetical protein LGH70_10950 [Hymenobacter sp. BT635]|uniref:DUF304 domain-containing protein n=1 Tax=Hymenobacter nitidus TaxID=2880929 RepID=A0ABS8ACH2_9BACT|nr:hypothetical protein [Hymenobacter nitidus]MCB2378103.1 hypothetical protein [Hymenobacter nitidus]